MVKRIIKIDQLSNRAASMAGTRSAERPQAPTGLGDSILNRFKFRKGTRD